MFGFGKWNGVKTATLFVILIMRIPASLMAQEAGDELGDISLSDLLNLEVSVATKSEMAVEEVPSIVSVITGEEIRNMGARNLEDVLRTVPGFDMTHDPTRVTHQVGIRGMMSPAHNNKIKVMMDGHSLSAFFGSAHYNFNTIPVSNVRQIEIIRGPGSALYGTGAFLGVINIITQKDGDGPSVLAVEGGSFDTIRTYGRLSYKNEDFNLSLYADYYDTEGEKERVDSDRFGTSPASAAPGYTSNHLDNYTFKSDISYNGFYFSGFFQKLSGESPIGIVYTLTDEDDTASTYVFGEIGYKTAIADKGNLEIRAFYDYGEQDALVEIFSEENAAALFGWTNGESVFGKPYEETRVLGGEITVAYEIISGMDLVAGASYEYIDMFDVRSYATANITGAPLEIRGVTYAPMQYLGGLVDISENGNWVKASDRTVYSVYAQSIFDIKESFSLKKGVENLSVIAGVRYDHYDDFGETVNPRFGLVYAPTSKLWIKALYGEAFRAPNFSELYAMNNPSRTGNPDVKPETITTAEGQIRYHLSKNLSASLTFFNVSAEDLIQTVIREYSNVGQMESRGVEAELRWQFDRRDYAYLNATWQDVKDTTHAKITSAGGQVYVQKDFNPGGSSDFIANAGVNWVLSDHVVTNLSANYVGERSRSEEMVWDGEDLVKADSRDPVKDRVLVNASLTLKNLYKGVEIQLSAYNLFDADHRSPDPSGGLENDLPLAGISFMGRISYSF